MIEGSQRFGRRFGPWLFWAGVLVCLLAVAMIPVGQLGLLSDDALHIDRRPLATWAGVVGLTWASLLVLAFVSLSVRVVRYRAAHAEVPSLLWRDILSKAGLAIPVTLVFVARLFIGTALQQQPPAGNDLTNWMPWVVMTTIPPLLGMGAFVFWEIFVIEADA